jgi:hypothetical protein
MIFYWHFVVAPRAWKNKLSCHFEERNDKVTSLNMHGYRRLLHLPLAVLGGLIHRKDIISRLSKVSLLYRGTPEVLEVESFVRCGFEK